MPAGSRSYLEESVVILSLGEAASVGLRWAKRWADGCSWDVWGGPVSLSCLLALAPSRRIPRVLSWRALQGDPPTPALMVTILLTADVFGMFTTCQALGLEPYGALRFHPHTCSTRASLSLFHFKDQQCERQRGEAACWGAVERGPAGLRGRNHSHHMTTGLIRV